MSDSSTNSLFDGDLWASALEKCGAVIHLSVALFSADGQMVCGPIPGSSLYDLLTTHDCHLPLFAECAKACLSQPADARPPILVSHASGLSVIGVALSLRGTIVGALTAGYAMDRFSDSVAISRLAHDIGVPFSELWNVIRKERPVPRRRLDIDGELLQVFGDTLIRESDLLRDSEANSERLSHLAGHDVLTGLPNRLLLTDRLSRTLATARRYDRCLAVLFLDIDHFKHINDSAGHLIGDELLRVVARELTGCIRHSDSVGRQGGDEFIVILSELTHAEDAGQVANKILVALRQPLDVGGGQELHITGSIGISAFPADGDDPETLLGRADMALYSAKERGRDGYRFFEPALNDRAIERRSVETGLRTALQRADRSEFELVYQPKIRLATGAVAGAEALIRWRRPEFGLVPPAQFIPIAQECGLIRQIGGWVAREACRQARAWQDAGLPPFPIAINTSPTELRSADFVKQLIDVLTETHLDARFLEIELTEGSLLSKGQATKDVLRALRAMGVRLALDDFGTGYSGLSYLRDFPIDILKIDRSFVSGISSALSAVVTAVISLGKAFNLQVVAEGIETSEQLEFLKAHDCEEGQGYYFSQPLTPDNFAEFLRNRMGSSGSLGPAG